MSLAICIVITLLAMVFLPWSKESNWSIAKGIVAVVVIIVAWASYLGVLHVSLTL